MKLKFNIEINEEAENTLREKFNIDINAEIEKIRKQLEMINETQYRD